MKMDKSKILKFVFVFRIDDDTKKCLTNWSHESKLLTFFISLAAKMYFSYKSNL